jgi:hypothetical protein
MVEKKKISENYDDLNSMSEKVKKAINYIVNLSKNQRDLILELLKEVQKIQKSDLSSAEKTTKIKTIMWASQSARSKLFIGGFLGSVVGLIIFGTGGVGIAGLGSAIGVWGFLAGTAGGVFVSSLIQNFKNNKEK